MSQVYFSPFAKQETDIGLGVDIDWEYPGAPDRGGVNADTENYVTLLKEMRAAWGSKYGISATLPSSYWYMRWFDVKGLFSLLCERECPSLSCSHRNGRQS